MKKMANYNYANQVLSNFFTSLPGILGLLLSAPNIIYENVYQVIVPGDWKYLDNSSLEAIKLTFMYMYKQKGNERS